MYLFSNSGNFAIIQALIGFIIFITSIGYFISGIVKISYKKSEDQGKKNLSMAFVLFIIGIGVCGSAQVSF